MPASKPSLIISRLEGNISNETLAFDGESVIANLVVRPGKVDGLDSAAGRDLTDNDPRYLRNWQVSKPFVTDNFDFNYNWLPNDTTIWAGAPSKTPLSRCRYRPGTIRYWWV